MVRSFLFSIATAALAMSAPLLTMSSLPSAAIAQTPTTSPTPSTAGDDCFAIYPFGHISMTLADPSSGAQFAPGDLIKITGQLRNDSHARLPAARVFVRILREDVAVAEEHWHPIVAELEIPDITIPAHTGTVAGEATFSGEWQLPAFAPPGTYRIETSLLAADGSPLVGVPYVANVFGATRIFEVSDAGHSSAVAWQRDQVFFNGSPFAFRAVPPRPESGPLTITAPLRTSGGEAVSVNVEKALYAWTDMEGDTLVNSTTEELLVMPGEEGNNEIVTFTWEAPTPGVYELVLKAVPLDPQVLPSLLRVRFYYEGTVPRILHTGMREESDGSGTVAACFFNSTFGPAGGSGVVRVLQNDSLVEEHTVSDIANESMRSFVVPAVVVKGGFSLVAEAKDLQGAVTDTETVQFPPLPKEGSAFDWSWVRTPTTWWVAGGAAIVIVLLGLLSIVRRRRHRFITEPL